MTNETRAYERQDKRGAQRGWNYLEQTLTNPNSDIYNSEIKGFALLHTIYQGVLHDPIRAITFWAVMKFRNSSIRKTFGSFGIKEKSIEEMIHAADEIFSQGINNEQETQGRV